MQLFRWKMHAAPRPDAVMRSLDRRDCPFDICGPERTSEGSSGYEIRWHMLPRSRSLSQAKEVFGQTMDDASATLQTAMRTRIPMVDQP